MISLRANMNFAYIQEFGVLVFLPIGICSWHYDCNKDYSIFEEIKFQLSWDFEMTDLGKAKKNLGMGISKYQGLGVQSNVHVDKMIYKWIGLLSTPLSPPL